MWSTNIYDQFFHTWENMHNLLLYIFNLIDIISLTSMSCIYYNLFIKEKTFFTSRISHHYYLDRKILVTSSAIYHIIF